ncbi:MAG: response regulator [Tateyamaria sp.]|uniref:response regulator n=1 Tax=Tateyamaria sp. TaxID=1929288 RepID=UPI003275960A
MLKKVLIIEDDPVLRASIEQTLELDDLEPIPTNGFVHARRSIRSNFRGVILSDIKMPDHDGFDVLGFAQARDPDLPVVLLTGHSDVPTAMRALREGAYEYLEKPCEPQRVIDVLRRALAHRALVLENRAMREELDQERDPDASGSLSERLEAHERQIIEQALSDESGKVAAAAARLGIPRNTLYDRMNKLRVVAKAFRSKHKQ